MAYRKTSNSTSEDEDDEWALDGFDEEAGINIKPLNGASHWSRIACEFDEAGPYLFGTEALWQQRYRQLKSIECLFPSLEDNVNFPFSNTNSAPKDEILGSFPPNHILNTLVSGYLDTFGATHCLFHPAQLRYEIQHFYEAPSTVSDEWLAQFCMILALGSQSASDFLFSGSGQSAAKWSEMFLNAAQASFSRSSYMVSPTLCTVRTLCMMVLAKLAESSASGGSVDVNDHGSKETSNGYTPLVSLMAFAMRIATSLQLHRSVATSTATDSAAHNAADREFNSQDVEMRRRIWVTVRILDLGTAIRTGTAMQSDACDVEPPQPLTRAGVPSGLSDGFNAYNTTGCLRNCMCEGTGCYYFSARSSYSYGDGKTTGSGALDGRFDDDPDGLYQYKLATALPLFASIVNAANSPTKPNPSYRRVESWDARVRKQLNDIRTTLLSRKPSTASGEQVDYDWQAHTQRGSQTKQQSPFGILAVDQSQRTALQFQHWETLTHRVLLALHHNQFCQSLSSVAIAEGSGDTQIRSSCHEKSRVAVIESALALLKTQKEWATALTDVGDRCSSTCTNMTTAATVAVSPFPDLLIKDTAAEMIIQQHSCLPLSKSPPASMYGSEIEVVTAAATTTAAASVATSATSIQNTAWLLDVCHDDFAAALMYLVLALRAALCKQGRDAEIVDSLDGCEVGLHGGSSLVANLSGFPPPESFQFFGHQEAAAVVAIRHSYQVLRDRSYRSVAHFKEFLGVAILFACYRGLQSGGDMLSQVVDATNDVEQVVVAGRRYLLWAADSFATPSESLMGFGGPLIYASI